MVDDIICVTDASTTKTMNNVINTFIESKKLKLSQTKCFQIHIGKGHKDCPKLKVHESDMKEVNSEKYLGDIIDETGSIKATINHRKSKGQDIISEIFSIINEIPIGSHRIVVAMKLREVMLLNGILYNSEAWHGMTKEDVKTLETIDESLKRALLKAHAKTAREFLYLEVGATPIKWIISQRRVNCLKHIIQKEDDELVKKVYMAQRDNPTSGDFVKLVEKDMEDLNVTYEQVASMDKIKLKKMLKLNATNAAFKELKEKLKKHKKVKHMKYEHFEIQSYLQSKILHPEEARVVTALRSQCVKNV